ncbi:MAG: hypothetical protein KDI03_12115 [Anaerolineae bacterium]|nr:hypothetical protein [Anaerolineae bacterium]
MISKSALMMGIELEKLREYLSLTGWRQQEFDRRWLVFQGAEEANAQDLEVVLVADRNASDYWNYFGQTVELLSALRNEDIETTLRRVQFVDMDVLNVRNVDTGGYDSISLALADTQVGQLKQLIRYAASSEKEPRPYFNQAFRIGDSMVDHFRFGQTFRGSFGLSIESPLHRQEQHLRSHRYEQQPSLFDDDPDSYEDVVVPPLERRVMERVVRGLGFTRISAAERNPDILVREYGSGLNGNMCRALVRAASDKEYVMEYSVLWSPRLSPTEDVLHQAVVRLNEVSYDILTAALQQLRTIEPEVYRVRGLVTNLGAESDPLSESTASREVAIKWINRPDNARPVKVLVHLNRQEYVLAHQAHLSWSTVEVTGIVEKVGAIWRLIDPRDFTVENLPPSHRSQLSLL